MALIKCVECGHDVSDKAQMCMNCGCPVSEILKELRGEVTKGLSQESRKVDLSITIKELYEQEKINRPIASILLVNGISNLHDLVNSSEKEICHFRRLGRRNYLRLIECMEEMGLSFAPPVFPEEAAKVNVANLAIDEKAKECLKNAGIETVNDILNISSDAFMRIPKLNRVLANQILDCLKEIGVPKYFVLELYWGLEEDSFPGEVYSNV